MLIRFGEHHDVSFGSSDKHNDCVVVLAYGRQPTVVREDGREVRPFFDETGYENIARAWFHLVPFGRYGSDPFPEHDPGEFLCEPHPDDRSFIFRVQYERSSDGTHREAEVTLRAYLDDPISWGVIACVDGVTFEEDSIESINRDIGTESLRGRFLSDSARRPTSEDLLLSIDLIGSIGVGDPASDSLLASLCDATGLDVRGRVRSWQAESVPIKEQCVALSVAARERGWLVQWLIEKPKLSVVPRKEET